MGVAGCNLNEKELLTVGRYLKAYFGSLTLKLEIENIPKKTTTSGKSVPDYEKFAERIKSLQIGEELAPSGSVIISENIKAKS